MSDKRVHFTSFEGKIRIILAGINDSDSIAGMIRHVFNSCKTEFIFMPEISESGKSAADIVVLTGIDRADNKDAAYFDDNVGRLRTLASSISDRGTLIYFYEDAVLRDIADESRADIKKIPYKMHGHFQNKLGFFAATHNRTVPVTFDGDENMKSLSAAREVCLVAGVSEDDFYEAMKSFVGALL